LTELQVVVSSRVGIGPSETKSKTLIIPPDYGPADIKALTRRTVEDTAFAHSDAYTGGAVTKRSLLIQVARLRAIRSRVEDLIDSPEKFQLIGLLDRDGELILQEWGEDPID